MALTVKVRVESEVVIEGFELNANTLHQYDVSSCKPMLGIKYVVVVTAEEVKVLKLLSADVYWIS